MSERPMGEGGASHGVSEMFPCGDRIRVRGFALVVAFAGSLAGASLRGDIVINEIHYEPIDKTAPEEFIELYNTGDEPVDLSGWFFSSGIRFVFDEGTTLAPGDYLVVAEDPEHIVRLFGAPNVAGPFEGRLENDGERVVLRNAVGDIEDTVDYQLQFPWPLDSGGRGSSMELIHPSLDNDLAGSWRASGFLSTAPTERSVVLEPAGQWRYRKGTSEASDPVDAWRNSDFVEDDTWETGQTPIGFNDDDDNTLLEDMRNNYSSVFLRRTFQFDGESLPEFMMAGLWVDDGCVVWINGVEVARFRFEGDPAFDDTAPFSFEAREFQDILLPAPSAYLKRGENTIAVQAFNQSLRSNDFSIDVMLFLPNGDDLRDVPPFPTPGSRNTAFAETAPPQIRQVDHSPQQPAEDEPISISAKVTDSDGVGSVELLYQIVLPGEFIPAFLPLPHAQLMANGDQPNPPNPAFEDPENWTTVTMLDDGGEGDELAGDSTYSAQIPAQSHRTLVRYRIRATDALGSSVRVPFPDDTSLNFACFVYNGVPEYVADHQSVHPDGPGHVYPAEVMTAIPVHHVITRAEEMTHCVSYSGSTQIPKSNERARDKFNWECAFVYDGVVYDHVRYRLRQANDRYGGSGKRSMRFRFNKGHYFAPRDQYGQRYESKWRTLNTGKGFDNKDVGNFGLTEAMNANLWNLVGVPAPWFYTYHMRVIDDAEEVPERSGQYLGDFWGFFSGIEDYSPQFLDEHDLEDGNLYKLKDGVFNGNDLRRNQGRNAVTTDADFQNIRRSLRPERDDEWLHQHVNYDRAYYYHAVIEGIRHYDFVPADSHSKNRAWYFEPHEGSEFGRLWTLPWDSDASWGPNWNSGIDYTLNAITARGGKLPFLIEYRNALRDFVDLVWKKDVIEPMIDDLAEFIIEFSSADRDRWRTGPSQAGRQDFGPIERKIVDMKRFAFVGWSGGSGPTVPAGGRERHLENLANSGRDRDNIPATPEVASQSPEGFPIDQLSFSVSEFSDPNEEDEFGGIHWRIGEVSPPDTPLDRERPRPYEFPAVWQTESAALLNPVTIPSTELEPGRTYRVRARMKDSTGRFSHWSAPIEFVAGEPTGPSAPELALRITELMYNPEGDEDYEFIELQNISGAAIELAGVEFADGIDFEFSGGEIPTLDAGAYVVVVRNRTVFEKRYGTDVPIAGEYSGRLSNGGESVLLRFGRASTVIEFVYSDTWIASTDGGGRSLVIRDPSLDPATWNDPASWVESAQRHGSPGRAEGEVESGLQRPGNIDQDGILSVSDAIAILRILFHGVSAPCGSGDASEPANQIVLDIDGSGGANVADALALVQYLFRRGDAPALGRECVPIEGCPDACVR